MFSWALMTLVAGWAPGAPAAETLRLVGTVYLSPGDGMPSHAVFETADGRQLIIDIDQEIDGCRLAKVDRSQATMDCAEGLISLTLRSDLSGPPPAQEIHGDVYQVTLPGGSFALAARGRQGTKHQLSLEPAVRGGSLYGYRVVWLERGGDFYRLGLRENDVVVSLNSTPANIPGPFMQAVSGLRGQTAFQLTVERNGRLIAYSYLLD